jgi:hypothetical protein
MKPYPGLSNDPQRDALPDRAARHEQVLLQRLELLRKNDTIIRDVRGRGANSRSEKIGAGRNVLTFMSPLIVEEGLIGRVMDEPETVLHEMH